MPRRLRPSAYFIVLSYQLMAALFVAAGGVYQRIAATSSMRRGKEILFMPICSLILIFTNEECFSVFLHTFMKVSFLNYLLDLLLYSQFHIFSSSLYDLLLAELSYKL